MSEIREAACAVLLREGSSGTEVYLVRRSVELSFLGGFDVFPGGTLDDIDTEHLPANPHMATAVRELFEETGVLLLSGASEVGVERRQSVREALVKGEPAGWRTLVAELGMIDDLSHAGDWVTPPYAPVIYHADYFWAWLPTGEEPEIWDGELTAGSWHTPAGAIEAHRRSDLFISYPVLETLRVMVRAELDLVDASAQLLGRTGSHPEGGGEILRGIHVCPVKTFTLPPATHTNCYVLGGTELVIIDPATPIEEDQQRLIDYLRFLEGRGHRIREIWLTHQHKDHIGAVDIVRRTFDIPVAAHRLTAEALAGDVEVDRFIEDEERTEFESDEGANPVWIALHTPGHARGHLCFYEELAGTMISGDNVLGLGTVLISPPEGNMVDYFASLRRMKDRRLGFMLPAHGPPIAAAQAKIDFYITHRSAREAAIVNAIGDGELEPSEIVPIVYTDVNPMIFGLAEINVRAHLEKLVAEARVVHKDGRYARVR